MIDYEGAIEYTGPLTESGIWGLINTSPTIVALWANQQTISAYLSEASDVRRARTVPELGGVPAESEGYTGGDVLLVMLGRVVPFRVDEYIPFGIVRAQQKEKGSDG